MNEGHFNIYDKSGDFHPYPDAAKQGTVLVLTDESMNVEEVKEFQNLQNMSKEERKARAEKQKEKKIREKDKIKKQKLKEAKRRKKLKDSGTYDIADHLQVNKDIKKIEQTIYLYSTDWRNIDEYLNKYHNPIQEWVSENELAKIHKDLRYLVDEYMRLEHELLKKAWCFDKKKNYKPPRQKIPKIKTRTKIRKIVDLTAHRTIESMYQELQESGIIEKYINKSFNAFIAEFNFLADDTRNQDNLVTIGPTKGDIKMIIQDCMLGLGEFMVEKPKSICIIGPQNNGKKLLCNIIASELDALFMNLSPENTHLFGDDLNYFIHIVMKVAKAFQPTILFIHDAHRIFSKNVPKDEMSIPSKVFQSIITKKILKDIKMDDKILLLGTSGAPWNANVKFQKVFQKIMLMPTSDYGTTFLLWLDLLSQRIREDTYDDYIISALSNVFRTYNTGDITDNVVNTLNIKRRMMLHSNSLNPMEFLEYFMVRQEPLFPPQEKIIQKFEKWSSRTNVYDNLRRDFLLKKQVKKEKKK